MNKQRKEVYAFRNEILKEEEAIKLAEEVLKEVVAELASPFFTSKGSEDGWDPQGFAQNLMTHFPITVDVDAFDDDYLTREDIEKEGAELILSAFKAKLDLEAQTIATIHGKEKGPLDPFSVIHQVIRNILLKNIDKLWQEHLLSIDHLRTEVHMRVVGQKDPLMEFKHEAFALFDTFSRDLKLAIAHAVFKFQIIPSPKEHPLPPHLQKGDPSTLFR